MKEEKDLCEQLSGISESIYGIAESVHRLGNGNASTNVGAIEGLAMVVRDGMREVAESLNNVAHALCGIADKMPEIDP